MMPMEGIVNNLPFFTEQALQKIESLGLSLSSRAEVSSVPPEINYSWQRLELKGVTYPYCTEQEERALSSVPLT